MQRARAIIITGPVGAGKTTTMWALTYLLERNDVACAGIDMDALRWFYPTPADDPFGSRIGFHHLNVMATTYRELGIPTLVLADVIEEHTDRHATAMPGYEVIAVRLAVDIDRLHARLRSRETGEHYGWYENRAIELTGIMERNGIGDVVIEVDDETPQAVAQRIADRLGLLGQ